MRHWSQLATRNWRARLGRTLGAVLAIALGAGSVVWVTCCYESIRRSVLSWSEDYIGNAQVMITSPLGKYDQIPERLVETVLKADNVASATPSLVQRLRAAAMTRAELSAASAPSQPTERTPEVDLIGVLLPDELAIRDHGRTLRAGRMLTELDTYACLLESAYAADCGVGVDDSLLVYTEQSAGPVELRIVGLVERRRVTKFQKAVALVPLRVLQQIRSKQALVTNIDLVLKEHSEADVKRTTTEIRTIVRPVARNATIRSVEMRMQQIQRAQSQQHFVLVLLSSVAMLTALFIILSTLSMGMIERIGQLGLMRCVGMTRLQLAWLVLAEVVPLGVIGIALGVPVGLGLTGLTVMLVPDYVGQFTISYTGIGLALAAGLMTTIVAALLPAIAVMRVSPLEATRPRARPARPAWLGIVAAAALLLLVVQHWVLVDQVARTPSFVQVASVAVVCLYLAYAMLAPAAVRLVGSPAVIAAAAALRVATRLVQDQVGHAAWRAAGVCCGLMVGLSLIVGIFVTNDSVTRGWQFPTQFPEAYVWSLEQMTGEADQRVRGTPGVKEYTVANALNVFVEERPAFMAEVFASVTWFLGMDPDSFLDLVNFEFKEGRREDAIRLLKEGGHVLVADDFARSRNKHLGDTVRIIQGQTQKVFTIAGVITSPAIDIAAGYFQAQTEYNVAASGSVIGTNEDLKRFFRIDGSRMVLINFDLPPEPAPADFPPKERRNVDHVYFDERIPLDRRWQRYREEQVLREVVRRLGSPPNCFLGTIRDLKDEIDAELTRITQLMTAVPAVALLVAAIGVANLMTANVTARARQIAVLRAIGATRGVVLRMVVGEAIVLGVLGSALGLLLGIHLASDITALIERMWGYRVALTLPWNYILGAASMTIGLCIVAGILPARYAARTNVVDALHVT